MSEVLVVENFVKKYGDFEVVKGVFFKVKRGEIFVFFGLNGVGKIIIVYVFMMFLRLILGRVIVVGYDVVEELMEVRKRIGIVF